MSKQIISIEYSIPGKEDICFGFSGTSLMDADVLLISPDSIKPWGDWISFTSSDGGCYNVEASNRHRKRVEHLRKEIGDHLNSGKNVFVFLTRKENEQLASGVSSPRKGQNSYSTYSYSNYEFLPTKIGKLSSASGRHIQFSGNPIFSGYYNCFKNYMEYELYVEEIGGAEKVFTGKDTSKVLGAIYKVGAGHLVTLPVLNYKESEFTEIRKNSDGEKEEFWNNKGLDFGKNLVQHLLDIDSKLSNESERTLAPEWSLRNEYSGKKEAILEKTIKENDQEVEKLHRENEELNIVLSEERELKNLLFEQGAVLENAVIKALKILGYTAENYDDGELEMDQVIVSPEGYRYIGENEGRDNKEINITKFRQLVDALNADFARDEVDEKAFGLLFGNAERLKDPSERKLGFTTKCISGAEREKIGLIRTIDLFRVAKYLNDNNNEKFRKDCRKAIHKALGKIIEFPKIPAK